VKRIVIACLVPGILAFGTISPLNAATKPSVATPSTTSAPTPGMTAVIRYLGGTVPNAQIGHYIGIGVASDAITFATSCKKMPTPKKEDSAYKMDCDQSSFKKRSNWAQQYVVTPSAIKTASLSQETHHRIISGLIVTVVVDPIVGVIVMCTKGTKHFVSITWNDNGKAGSAEFQADKSNYRRLLTSLSSVSGVTVTESINTHKK